MPRDTSPGDDNGTSPGDSNGPSWGEAAKDGWRVARGQRGAVWRNGRFQNPAARKTCSVTAVMLIGAAAGAIGAVRGISGRLH
jgi:hypothetical protein